MATAERIVHVEFTDVGPVRKLSIDVPETGIIVLKGGNGAGKTTLLNAVDTADRGVGKPPIADGSDRAEVRLGDVLLRVGKRNQKSGEQEFGVLDGKFSIADLIAPGYKSLESCDEHAIKTLAQLAGSGETSLFYELVGGQAEFEKLIPAEVAGDLDVVALAGRIERALQSRARVEEEAATGADGKADAYSAAAANVDLTAPHGETALAEARNQAVCNCAALEQKAADAAKRSREARAAQDALDDAEAETDGPTIEAATEALTRAKSGVSEHLAHVNQLEQQLRNAREDLARAESGVREAETVLKSAQNNAAALSKFRAVVEAAQDIEQVSDNDLIKARAAVEEAKQAELRGRDVRNAIASKEQSETWRKTAAERRKEAARLRTMADGTDEVLSGLVAKLGSPLFVERGRLLITSDRGKERFWDLSDGERSEIAVTVFANAVRNRSADPTKPCRLALPQSFWEGLDFNGRKRIAQLMDKLRVQAWTAEAVKNADERTDLHAEVYQG
jgi:hypothetical protein